MDALFQAHASTVDEERVAAFYRWVDSPDEVGLTVDVWGLGHVAVRLREPELPGDYFWL